MTRRPFVCVSICLTSARFVSRRAWASLACLLLVLSMASTADAQFIDPIIISDDTETVFTNPGISLNTNDDLSVVFEGDEQIYFASSLIGFGVDTSVITDAADSASGARIAAGSLGLSYVVFAQESTEPGAVGSDIRLVNNNGGPFTNFTDIATTLDDEFEPSLSFSLLGDLDLVWAEAPGGADPEVRFQRNDGASQFVANGKVPQIASTIDGDAHLIYQRVGNVFYSRYDSGLDAFDPEEQISDLAGTESNLAVCTDEAGVVHVTFQNGGDVYYTNNAGGTFDTPAVVVTGPVAGSGLAARTEVSIVYGVELQDAIERIETDGGVFGDAEVIASGLVDAANPRAGYDSGDYLHVVYETEGEIAYTNDVPAPSANFTAAGNVGPAPVTADFTNLSTGIFDTVEWDFGDGTQSTSLAPEHTYEQPGFYNVTLTISGPGGTSTLTRTNYVIVQTPDDILRYPAITAAAGAAVSHPAYATNDLPLQGFLVRTRFDDAFTPVSEVNFDGTATGSYNPEFEIINFEGTGDESTVTVSIIFDTEAPFDGRALPPEDDHLLLTLEYVVPATLVAGDTSEIILEDAPPTVNIFSSNDPVAGTISTLPFLINGSLTVVDSTETFLRGDVNLNGFVDIGDPISTLTWLFQDGTQPSCLDSADFNDNGSVDLTDVIQTLSFLFSGGGGPLYPYPTAGTDPTADTLECTL